MIVLGLRTDRKETSFHASYLSAIVDNRLTCLHLVTTEPNSQQARNWFESQSSKLPRKCKFPATEKGLYEFVRIVRAYICYELHHYQEMVIVLKKLKRFGYLSEKLNSFPIINFLMSTKPVFTFTIFRERQTFVTVRIVNFVR